MMNRYSNESRKAIVNEMIIELKKLPGGTEISTAELFNRLYPELKETFDERDLLDLHMDLMEMAAEEGLFLDMSEWEGLMVGYPCYLDFTICHK